MATISSSQFHQWRQQISRLPYPFATLILLPLIAAIFALIATYTITTIRFHLFSPISASNKATTNVRHPTNSGTTITPRLLPYTIPWLGHALTFLAPRPGRFFDGLLKVFRPSSTTSIKSTQLLLAGRRMFILWDVTAVQAIFRNRTLDRHEANVQVVEKGLGLTRAERQQFYAPTEERKMRAEMERKGLKPPPITKEWIEEDRLNDTWLLGQQSVNQLTHKFIEVFRAALPDLTATPTSSTSGGDNDATTTAVDATSNDDGDWKEVNLYTAIRPIMFRASTTAFMGEQILSIYKQRSAGRDLHDDFFELDRHFLSMFFGIPRWISPDGYRVRERMAHCFTGWEELWDPSIDLTAKKRQVDNGAAATDGDDGKSTVWWEPRMGSRFFHERQKLYDNRGLSTAARGRFDMGFLFGLSSNAIPATGWMMARILTTDGLLARVREEIQTAVRVTSTASQGDGFFGEQGNPSKTGPKLDIDIDIDVPTLVVLPFLNSILHETLRLYTDVLVTRELTEDLLLPLTAAPGHHHHPGVHSPSAAPTSSLLLKKNSLAVCPSWMGHRDPSFGIWDDQPNDTDVHTFCPDRFLRTDKSTQKQVFSTADKLGKFFPFGGGKTICPGRVFAKQEVLAAVAMLLTNFEWDVLGFVDENGCNQKEFPGLRKGFAGAGVMSMDGDVKVRVRRRRSRRDGM